MTGPPTFWNQQIWKSFFSAACTFFPLAVQDCSTLALIQSTLVIISGIRCKLNCYLCRMGKCWPILRWRRASTLQAIFIRTAASLTDTGRKSGFHRLQQLACFNRWLPIAASWLALKGAVWIAGNDQSRQFARTCFQHSDPRPLTLCSSRGLKGSFLVWRIGWGLKAVFARDFCVGCVAS